MTAWCRTGTRRRIPADGADYIYDTVQVRSRIYRSAAVAGTMASDAPDAYIGVKNMLTDVRRNSMTGATHKRSCSRHCRGLGRWRTWTDSIHRRDDVIVGS